MQVKHCRSGALWNDEKLNRLATQHVRENANPKGSPNMTAKTFCQWVKEDLLPYSTLQPSFPRHISIETARKWLHHLGFEVIKDGKGIYIDGHEREDAVDTG